MPNVSLLDSLPNSPISQPLLSGSQQAGGDISQLLLLARLAAKLRGGGSNSITGDDVMTSLVRGVK